MKYGRQGTVALLNLFSPVVVSEKAFSLISIPLCFKCNSIIKRFFCSPPYKEKEEVIKSILASEVSSFLCKTKLSKLDKFFKKKSDPSINYCFVIDCAVAEDIVKKILSKEDRMNSIFIEGNPGLGLISLHLIKSEVLRINFYDKSSLVSLSTKQILEKNKNNYQIISKNLFTSTIKMNIFKLFDCESDGIVEKNMKKIVIGVVPNYTFFSRMVYDIQFWHLWDYIELTEFYFVISIDVHNKILEFKSPKGKLKAYCLYNFIFETEVMAEYPREAFLPFSTYPHNKMLLIRAKKRANIFAHIGLNEVPFYAGFLKILGRSNYNFLFPLLEDWFPNCRPYLTSKGISYRSRVKDLSFSEYEKLFNHITKYSEYENFKDLTKSLNIVNVTEFKTCRN